MSNGFNVYHWIPQNKDYLSKLLRFLERMESETWIERKPTFFGRGNLYNQEPSQVVISREVVATIESSVDRSYPNLVSFDFRGGRFPVFKKTAFDYGRCVMYLCEGSGMVYPTDDLHILLYDRRTGDWYHCVTLCEKIDSFLNWVGYHL